MLPENQRLFGILDALYEAPLDPSQWEEFLRLITQATGGRCAGLLVHDARRAEHSISLQWGIDPEAIRLYAEHYGKVDIWQQRAAPLAVEGWVGVSEEVISPRELAETEIYNDYFRLFGVAHAAWSIPESTAGTISGLGVYRGPREGDFDSDALVLLGILAPHVKRAIRLHFRLTTLRNRSESLKTALDAIPTGVILLSERMQIVAMNYAAERILAANNGLLATGGGLRAELQRESSGLKKLLTEAVRNPLCVADEIDAISVSRRNLPPLHLLVSPVRGLDSVRVIIFVTDPKQALRPASATLQSLFRLTPAECRVAMLLAGGQALSEMSGTLGVSRNTLKSQLASIYGKTCTSRQSELIRLLLQITKPGAPS